MYKPRSVPEWVCSLCFTYITYFRVRILLDIVLSSRVWHFIIQNLHCTFHYSHFTCWGKCSTNDIFKYVFLIFPRKVDLTFHANCLLSGSFCMTCQILFSRKTKKNTISLSSAESAHNMVHVSGKLTWH